MESVNVDEYVVSTLMRDLVGHDRQPAAYLVYLHLWLLTDGGRAGTAMASLSEIADGTGLSKRSVQSALARLHTRRLIRISRAGITAIPEYTVCRPWAK